MADRSLFDVVARLANPGHAPGLAQFQKDYATDESAMKEQMLRQILANVLSQGPGVLWEAISQKLGQRPPDQVEQNAMRSMIGHRMNEHFGGNPQDVSLDGRTPPWIEGLPSRSAYLR
jgi:hypothetical protein